MFAHCKLLMVVVFVLTLGACASTRPRKPVQGLHEEATGQQTAPAAMAQQANFSRRIPVGAPGGKGGGSRSFEAVSESTGQADTYGTSVAGTLDKAEASTTVAHPPGVEVGSSSTGVTESAQQRQGEPPTAAYGAPVPPAAPEGGQPPARPPSAADVVPGQMLVYTANLMMAVYQVEQGLATVERVARELDGYLATRGDLAITIRVPRAKFEIALKAIEGSGDVLHRDIKAEDVTDEFFDTEVRVRNARAMRDRLAKLLQQAAVKEALEIEKELARVTQEIELLEGKLKLLRSRVAYSTINVAFRPRGAVIDTRPTRLPFPWLEQLGLGNLLRLDDSE